LISLLYLTAHLVQGHRLTNARTNGRTHKGK